jgi:hypothetical protein
MSASRPSEGQTFSPAGGPGGPRRDPQFRLLSISPHLLDRFTTYEEEPLAFLLHGVTFDNNGAERDLRMMKTLGSLE